MNTKGRKQGQLILVAGFLVAIAIIGVAMTLSGVFFTQNVEESGLSQFESSATSQQASADVAAHRSIDLTNLYGENYGINSTNLTKTLTNYMQNYTRTTQNVSQLQAIVNVTLEESTINRSWLAGSDDGPLPSIVLKNTTTRNETVTVDGRNPFDVVFVLDTTASMGFDYDYNTFTNSQGERYADVDDGYNGFYDDDVFSEGELLTSWDPGPSSYHEDPSAACNRSFNSDKSHQNDDLNEEYCDQVHVQGDDPGGESKYDVDMGDYVYNPENDQVGEVIDSNNCPGANCEWRLDYTSGGTEWVNESTTQYSSSEDVEVGDVVRNTNNNQIGVVTNQYYSYDYWYVDYNSSGSDWVSGSNLEVRQKYELEDRDIRYRYWIPKKMYYAKQAVRTSIGALNGSAIGQVDRADRVGIVEFDTTLNDNARQVQPITNVSGNKNTLNDTTDTIYDNYGNTYIAAGLEEARTMLQSAGNSDEVGEHIVLLSDGQNSDLDGGGNDDEDQETRDQSDLAENQNITIHTIALGDAADTSLLSSLTTFNGEDEEGDPEDLVDIFKQIIGNIRDNQTFTDTKVTQVPTKSETIEKIYELKMNVTDWEVGNTDQVSINITNTTDTGGTNVTRSVWKLTVNRTAANSYKVSLTTKDTPPQEMVINRNISEGDTFISFDVWNNEVRDQDGPISSFDLEKDVIESYLPASLRLENINTSAYGSFRFEFKPPGGNFSELDSGSGFSGLCGGNATCGTEQNGTYSTARMRHATISISYNSATGDYENEIEVDAD